MRVGVVGTVRVQHRLALPGRSPGLAASGSLAAAGGDKGLTPRPTPRPAQADRPGALGGVGLAANASGTELVAALPGRKNVIGDYLAVLDPKTGQPLKRFPSTGNLGGWIQPVTIIGHQLWAVLDGSMANGYGTVALDTGTILRSDTGGNHANLFANGTTLLADIPAMPGSFCINGRTDAVTARLPTHLLTGGTAIADHGRLYY